MTKTDYSSRMSGTDALWIFVRSQAGICRSSANWLASLCLLSVLGCACKQPQAVTRHTELNIKIGADLTAIAALPIGEAAVQFGRKVDETFKNTPGADTLDIMLYRICVTAERHKETITPEMELAMQKEAYKAWLKYVQGLERVALERVKRGLAGQPLGPPVAVSSAAVPEGTQARVHAAVKRLLAIKDQDGT